MWSLVSSSSGHHSLISVIIIVVSVVLGDQYHEQDRHGVSGQYRVSYDDHGYGYHRPRRVIVRKKIIRPRNRVHHHHDDRPLAVVPSDSLHPLAGHQGSYVAVSGQPGRGSVHVVENVPALGHDSVTVVNGVSVRSRHGSRTAVVPVVAQAPVHPVVSAPVAPISPVAPIAPQPAPSTQKYFHVS